MKINTILNLSFGILRYVNKVKVCLNRESTYLWLVSMEDLVFFIPNIQIRVLKYYGYREEIKGLYPPPQLPQVVETSMEILSFDFIVFENVCIEEEVMA